MASRIAKVMVEEAGFTKNTTVADVQWWAKQRYTSYFSERVLAVIEHKAYTVAQQIKDYWADVEEHNAEMMISRYI